MVFLVRISTVYRLHYIANNLNIGSYPSATTYDYVDLKAKVKVVVDIITNAATACQSLPVGAIGLLDVVGLIVAIIKVYNRFFLCLQCTQKF